MFVLPSLFENSPYTLLEAMSCGKPCVVSRAGGMTEMLTDKESGLFFEPGNPANLAEKVVNLLQDQRLQESIGRAARIRVQRDSSLETGVVKTLDFYKNVISKHG